MNRPIQPNSVFRFLVVALLFLATAGCSVKMAYNNMDRLVRWGVSDYVDLTSEQKDVLQREVEKVQAWHRKNHLPQYSAYARGMATQLPDGVSVANVADLFERFEVWSGEVESQLNPLVIEIMVSLSDEQIEELPERLIKSNAELAEPEQDVPLREAQLLWAKEFEEGLKNFAGRLSREQRNYLERRSLEYQPERVLWAEYRGRFQAELFTLLQKRQEAGFSQSYLELVRVRESYYGDELHAVFDNNQRLNREVTSHVLSNLSEKQTEKFVESLIDLSDDFAELAAEA